MATVPTGYVFWDVSANKSYAAGKTFPTLGNGDYLVPATSDNDGYYHVYFYYTSLVLEGIGTFTNCWSGYVQSQYKAQTQVACFNTIADKPVRQFQYSDCTFTTAPSLSSISNLKRVTYVDCPNLTTVPALPTSIASLINSFYNCPKLVTTSNIASLTNVQTARYAFYNCTSLVTPPTISGLTSLTDATGMFYNCSTLAPAAGYTIPSSVTTMEYMFYNCAALVNPVTIPASVTNILGVFHSCTNLEGFLTINAAALTKYTYAFKNTTKTIILVGTGASDAIANTATNSNVHNGIKAYPAAFTAIRCDSSGNESASGLYALLTISYTALNYSGALLMLPTLKKNGSAASATWHIGSKTGTTLTSSGTQIQSSGKLVAIFSLGDNTSAPNFEVVLNTKYSSYTWASSAVTAGVTFKEFILDVSANGKAIGLGTEASDSHEGLAVDLPNLKMNYAGAFVTPAMAGMISMFAGGTPPAGWHWCNGAALNRVEYAELFAVIGTTFGEGDGSTTFNLPNTRGRSPVGSGAGTGLTSRTMGDTFGEETHTLQTSEVPAHTHGSSGAITGGITGGSHSHHTAFKTLDRTKDNKLQDTRVGPYSTSVADTTQVSTDAQTHTHNLPNHTHTSVGGGGAHNNMQPSIVLGFIICTGKLT